LNLNYSNFFFNQKVVLLAKEKGEFKLESESLKDLILVQQVDRRWSNVNHISYKQSAFYAPSFRNIYQRISNRHQRAKSLCGSLQYSRNSIINYAIAMASDKSNLTTQMRPKDTKILQNHEKIMEIQNKWTGNGKFIIKEKDSTFVMVKSIFFLYKYYI
jgi:hypothetical protein